MIEQRDQDVLRDVARIAAESDLRFFVIGAGARLLVYDWPFKLSGGRATTDWDIAVRVATWAEYASLRASLTTEGAPFRVTESDHRLQHLNGRALDLVPFGGVETEDRTVTYPEGETTHSVLGLKECEDCCVEVPIGEGLSVSAVDAPGLVLLKAKTYLDRRPTMTHDIYDLDFIVRAYGHVAGDEALIDRASHVLQDEVVEYEDAGAYVLALDILALGIPGITLAPLNALVTELTDPISRAVDDLVASSAPGSARPRDDIAKRYAAMLRVLKG